MTIPFVKAHGARNDFLLTWEDGAGAADEPAAARAICDRHTGVGADGWILVAPAGEREDYDYAIRLFNSDGSAPEISGNGTRCAAAFVVDAGPDWKEIRLMTGAGVKLLRLLSRDGLQFVFEMNMGRPSVLETAFQLPLSSGALQVALVDVGNPQCAVPVRDFTLPWRELGAEIERHSHFPNRTNVSFFRVLDEHTLDVRFYERGAGETMSSGTGSTGAVAAASALGMVRSPVRVLTPAGPLELRWDEEIYLVGPAEIVAAGKFLMRE
ncbi:MAG: diaminopimelate epimerase [Bryobacteraceae bacterium]